MAAELWPWPPAAAPPVRRAPSASPGAKAFKQGRLTCKIWVRPLTFAAAWARFRFLAISIMEFRIATVEDCRLLAELNYQLIRDEGHRNRMTVPELELRMKGWLSTEYRAALFQAGSGVVAYALFRETTEEVYLRQLFVVPSQRRRGLGRNAIDILRSQLWPKTKRLTVDVLVANKPAVSFWRSIGYADYSLTLEILPGDSPSQ